MQLIDPSHPFYRPLWRRVLIVAVCLGWAVVEGVTSEPFWALLVGAVGIYAAWMLLVNFDPKKGTGIHYKDMEDILGSTHIEYTFLQAIPAGIHKSIETLVNYIRNLKLLFTSKEVKAQDSLGSVISIASVFPSMWDWQSFWTLTGIFSILLAFMNVLPIPALDGGHSLFLLIEMIKGKPLSDKFLERAQIVGFVLLVTLMVFVFGNDTIKLIFKK